jgi:hypothetical protein
MELGGVFILVLVLLVVGVLGSGLYALSMWLRGKKLAPEGDELESEWVPRPEHVEIENEQNARFVGTR